MLFDLWTVRRRMPRLILDTTTSDKNPGAKSRSGSLGSDPSTSAEDAASAGFTSSLDNISSSCVERALDIAGMFQRLFIITVSASLFVVTLVIVAALAFFVGIVTRLVLVGMMGANAPHPTQVVTDLVATTVGLLPTPVILGGKEVPPTKYTSRTFWQGGALTSQTVHIDRAGSTSYDGGEDDAANEVAAQHDDGDMHLPSGQHLLVDIKHVDPDFLFSEERLASAMIELVNEFRLTLLSYHCHSLVPMGVSCAGVLLESNVAFHTWPKHGVITIDLFTCGAGLLMPVIPTIRRLFGLPVLDSPLPLEPLMKWSHKLRGFREDISPGDNPHENPLEQDFGLDNLANHDIASKHPLLSKRTALQYVDMFEWHNPSKLNPESYEYLPETTSKLDEGIYLDGVQQRSLYGEAAHHEALVHPGMLAHPNPKRVAIIGGGKGATLREVLKHKTVESVTMVKIDEELVKMCREHLPEWSDCSDMEGSETDSCFDDSRAFVEFFDAFGWFIECFGKEDIKEGKFDVIIMDALDPDKFIAIVGSLYKDDVFINALYNGLSDGGVFVAHLGDTDKLNDTAAGVGPGKDKKNMGHSHLGSPWAYLVCFKDYKSRARWYKAVPELAIEIHQRLNERKSGRSTLVYFDAPTMMGYQLPSKAQETAQCRREDKQEECYEPLMDPEFVNVPVSHLKVEKSSIGEFGGRGLFAAQDISKNAILAVDGSIKSFHVLPCSVSVLENLKELVQESNLPFVESKASRFYNFMEGNYVNCLLLELIL
ncbi:hypothetical protein ACHAXA_007725 [Cyclostephanos tholiformis]|uniref:PABS domain-containing protein n=1 Tax=Cyclostephanos tholiformis TaxID=382380 RepID=A0ABD3RY87_9STRA